MTFDLIFCKDNYDEEHCYQWLPSSSLPGERTSSSKLGELRTSSTSKNASLNFTPHITLSPAFSNKDGIEIFLFILVVENSIVEIWKINSLHSANLCAKFIGHLKVTELDPFSDIACDQSGLNLNEITGDVTYFSLYITCPIQHIVKQTHLPIFDFPNRDEKLHSGILYHANLYQPTAVATSKSEKRKVAVIDGSSGNIFVFKQFSDFSDFILLNVINAPLTNLLSPASFACYDFSDNLWVTNYEREVLVQINGAKENIKKYPVHRIAGIVCPHHTLLIGCNAQQNSVTLHNPDDGTSKNLLGASTTSRPLAIVQYLNIIGVASRSIMTNLPIIEFYRLQV